MEKEERERGERGNEKSERRRESESGYCVNFLLI